MRQGAAAHAEFRSTNEAAEVAALQAKLQVMADSLAASRERETAHV